MAFTMNDLIKKENVDFNENSLMVVICYCHTGASRAAGKCRRSHRKGQARIAFKLSWDRQDRAKRVQFGLVLLCLHNKCQPLQGRGHTYQCQWGNTGMIVWCWNILYIKSCLYQYNKYC